MNERLISWLANLVDAFGLAPGHSLKGVSLKWVWEFGASDIWGLTILGVPCWGPSYEVILYYLGFTLGVVNPGALSVGVRVLHADLGFAPRASHFLQNHIPGDLAEA